MIEIPWPADKPLPYFAEYAHYLWGAINYDSDGNCKHPTDRLYGHVYVASRDRGDPFVRAVRKGELLHLDGSDPELVGRITLFLLEGEGEMPDWDHEKAMARVAPIRKMFEDPKLKPFDNLNFWGAWKWCGLRGSQFTWMARWIMHSLHVGDSRGVDLCIEWMHQGCTDQHEREAIEHALHLLTGESYKGEDAWLAWYDEKGYELFPEPDKDAWFKEWKASVTG